eukprot:gnl/Carplike_NY0171/7907_a10948_182.p1 GENE.gnl/Carplike_NY0171/7907_a10948_182~~gnl/Carplike_NY0171/7907_a10948_182.p1  ORF type:complete len:262 (+),score=48.12 gnl/Carplike_NY0171/7907_a10948_182:136-921(+)
MISTSRSPKIKFSDKRHKKGACKPLAMPSLLRPPPMPKNFKSKKKNDTDDEESSDPWDMSENARRMLAGEPPKDGKVEKYTYLSIPFTSKDMKGAHMLLSSTEHPPAYLILTFTSSLKERSSKRYDFPDFKGRRWFFLNIELDDVVLCEIEGEGRTGPSFSIRQLTFVRRETPEEIAEREAKEKLHPGSTGNEALSTVLQSSRDFNYDLVKEKRKMAEKFGKMLKQEDQMLLMMASIIRRIRSYHSTDSSDSSDSSDSYDL